MRIVSLLPSTTEIVFDLGLADQLLGVTFECNFPAEARVGREIVVGGMDTKHLTPIEIDTMVRERLARGDELYSLDDAALARCNPDLILSQDLCRVCAVPSGEVDAAVARLNCNATVLQIDPHTLLEVIASVQTVADAAGVPERGQALTKALHDRLDQLALRVATHLQGAPRPTVFMLEWVDPPFVGGHWVPDIVTAGGGEPVLAIPGGRSVPTTWDEIAAADPDHIIVSPCGYGLDGAIAQTRDILDLLPARAKVWAIDADAAGVPERGQALTKALHDRLDQLAQRVATHLQGAPRPTVFMLEWVDPPFVGGHWVPDIVTAGGGDPVLAIPGGRSVPTTWDEIAAADPDHIIVSPCGYGLDGAIAQTRAILDRLPSRAKVWAIDADAVVVRPGPRLVDGAEAIAAALFGAPVAGRHDLIGEVIADVR